MLEVRTPAMAGTYYPDDAAALRRQIAWCLEHPLGPGRNAVDAIAVPAKVYGIISPHAGYRYSGPVSAHAYAMLNAAGAADLAVIIGPNHRMLGAPVAASGAKLWRTPLGMARVDAAMAMALCEDRDVAVIDDLAHELEHSVEVQVPFLQYFFRDCCSLLPIVMHDQDLAVAHKLGQALAVLLKGRRAVVVASSDFTHYESHESATQKDKIALEAIVSLDPEALVEAVERHRITMCGPGPVIAAIVASRSLGATKAQLLRYATSGEMSGDYNHVVGYGALAFV